MAEAGYPDVNTKLWSGFFAPASTPQAIVKKLETALARAIRDQKGYEIDRRRIHILDEVKELGTYKAKVDFGNSNETEVEFEVSAE